MLFALDKDGNRIYIKQARVDGDYFCPECGGKLVVKKGEIRTHHFAHLTNTDCKDLWHYDMSEWHQNWQEKFPQQFQEIVKSKGEIKHRADVLLENQGVVIEFQHSSISHREFNGRNSFYNALGYKVVWVFDVAQQFENEDIINYRDNLFKWRYPHKALSGFDFKDKRVEVYFEIQNDADSNIELIRIKEKEREGYELFFDEEDYYKEHKNDKLKLIKVVWGIEDTRIFAAEDKIYSEEDITKYKNKSKYIEKIKNIQQSEKRDRIWSKNIYELWEEKKCNAAIFRNVRTNRFVKIIKDPKEQLLKYKRVFGYVSSDRFLFLKNSCEVLDCEKREWERVWYN